MAECFFKDVDQYSCSICLDLMTTPVTIPCGHSYCMDCIKSYWDKDELSKDCCPQCRQRFVPRPALNKNTMLAEIMEKLRTNDLNATVLAEKGDIACDFCTGKNVRAVHSCLQCRASYCEIHIQPHFDFPALKKHTLVNASDLPSCQKHDKLLEVFCRTDQSLICMLCLMDDHKGHDSVSSETERDEKQIKLQADRIKLEEKRKEKEQELHDLQKTQKIHEDAAQQAVESTKKAFTASVDFMQKKCSEVIDSIHALEKADLDRVKGLHQQLQLEIAVLRGRENELDNLLQTKDNISFLQNFKKILTYCGAADFHRHSLEPTVSFEEITKVVSKLKDSLEVFCKKEVEKILEGVSNLAVAVPSCCIKPGDRVRVKACVTTPKYNWGSHVTHKSIGVVKALRGETLLVGFSGHDNWKGVISEMELVTGPDKSASDQNNAIKAGDQVRVKATVDMPAFKWGGVSHRSLGVVKAVNGEKITVDFPECQGWNGVVAEMEVVSCDAVPGSSTANSSFRIGDKVRVTPSVVTPLYEWGGITHKSVGVVKSVEEHTVYVDFPEFQGWKGKISEMEIIPRIPRQESECFSSRIQIGDRVQVKATVNTPKHGWGEVSHKSVGTIAALTGQDITVNFPEQKGWLGALSEVELADSAPSAIKAKVQQLEWIGDPLKMELPLQKISKEVGNCRVNLNKTRSGLA